MIVVTGAAGKTGQAVIRALVARGAAVRAFVYRDKQRPLVKKLGVQDVVVGDMREAEAFRLATSGASAIYHICPNMNPDEVKIGRLALTAAGEAGVKHFVYHSVLHPQTEAMPHHWHKLRVEEMLFESGMDYTILQPAAYMQNMRGGWKRIVEEGIYQVPYPVETRLGMVDLQDVATVAAIVLTETGHIGATYELAGPDICSQTEMAALLSQCLERSVHAEEISHAAWAEGARAGGLGTYQIDTLLKMFRYYAQYGFWGNPNVLRWLLKREPTRLRDFFERVKSPSSGPCFTSR